MIFVNVSEGILERFISFLDKKNISAKKVYTYIVKIDYNYSKFIEFINKYSFLKRFIYRIYFTNKKAKTYKEIINKEDLKNKVLRACVHPKSKEEEVLKFLESKNISLNPTSYDHMLYIYKDQMYSDFRYGLLPKNKVYIKDNNDSHICRAYYKLKEIVSRENINLNNKIILDIGASPGGWCEYAKDYAKKIIAIDPAKLEIQADNIIYYNKKIEDIIPKINKYKYEIIISDINFDPKIVLEEIFKLNYENKLLILTLKFNQKREYYISRRVKKIKEDLKSKCKYIKHYFLFANTNSERTLICKFK